MQDFVANFTFLANLFDKFLQFRINWNFYLEHICALIFIAPRKYYLLNFKKEVIIQNKLHEKIKIR